MRLNKILLASVLTLGMFSGCAKEPVPNENRGTDYKFDIMDYLDIETFGENGDGYLEITLKEVTAKDFANDEDYINVRKDLDELDPYYLTDGSSSGISVTTPEETLSNGDVVTISFNLDDDEKYSDINTEDYEYTISGLEESLTSIDLFGSDFITIYGDSDNNIHLSKANSTYDFIDYLDYTGSANENVLEEGKTVVDVEVELDYDFANEGNYSDLKEYLAKEYKLKADMTGSVVLSAIAKTVDYATISSSDLYNTLFDYISSSKSDDDDMYISSILNIQRTEREIEMAPYECVVVYSTIKDNITTYYSKVVEIANVDGKLVIMNSSNTNTVDAEDARSLLNDTNVMQITF